MKNTVAKIAVVQGNKSHKFQTHRTIWQDNPRLRSKKYGERALYTGGIQLTSPQSYNNKNSDSYPKRIQPSKH